MTHIDTFAVIGGDLRTLYLAEQLVRDHYKVIASGFDATELPASVTGCTSPTQSVELSDCMILPLPVTADGQTLNAPFSRLRIPLAQVWRPGKPTLGGQVSDALAQQAKDSGVQLRDYFRREELAIQNAVPTAEGAVQLAMEELPVTVSGARCLITGFGRVGGALARLLVAMGAHVTVAARSLDARAWALVHGCCTMPIEDIGGDFDVVFNTVPALLFDDVRLAQLDKGTLLIDLASRPGGVDFNAAAARQIKTVWALSLPGRVAPKTAGIAIERTILHMLAEGLEEDA